MSGTVKLPQSVEKRISEEAAKANVSPNKLIALILEAFIDGGTIFLGTWENGERIVVAWPEMSHKIFRVPSEELEGRK